MRKNKLTPIIVKLNRNAKDLSSSLLKKNVCRSIPPNKKEKNTITKE